jgi:hypothetical protein
VLDSEGDDIAVKQCGGIGMWGLDNLSRECERSCEETICKGGCGFVAETYCIDISRIYNAQIMPNQKVSDLLRITFGMSHV